MLWLCPGPDWRYWTCCADGLASPSSTVWSAVVAYLFGLEGVERGVLILQSSMPVAVFNYLLALRYQREPGEVAGMVVLSTVLSFILLPFIVSFVLP